MTTAIDDAAEPPSAASDVETEAAEAWNRRGTAVVLAYVLAFVAAELLGKWLNLEAQVAADAVLLLLSLNHALAGRSPARRAGLVMAALSCSRLFTMTVPLAHASIVTRTAVAASANLTIAILVTRALRQDRSAGALLPASRTFQPMARTLASKRLTTVLVALSGLPLGLALSRSITSEAVHLTPFHGSTTLPWVAFVGALLLGAAGEEWLYRRVVAAMVHETAGSRSPLFSAALFAATYVAVGNVYFVALVFVAGALFAWSCERTGSLVGPVVAHFIAGVLVFTLR